MKGIWTFFDKQVDIQREKLDFCMQSIFLHSPLFRVAGSNVSESVISSWEEEWKLKKEIGPKSLRAFLYVSLWDDKPVD